MAGWLPCPIAHRLKSKEQAAQPYHSAPRVVPAKAKSAGQAEQPVGATAAATSSPQRPRSRCRTDTRSRTCIINQKGIHCLLPCARAARTAPRKQHLPPPAHSPHEARQPLAPHHMPPRRLVQRQPLIRHSIVVPVPCAVHTVPGAPRQHVLCTAEGAEPRLPCCSPAQCPTPRRPRPTVPPRAN